MKFTIEFIENFNKICSVINSCKTIEQLDNANEWAYNYITNNQDLLSVSPDSQKKRQVNEVFSVYLQYIKKIYDKKFFEMAEQLAA